MSMRMDNDTDGQAIKRWTGLGQMHLESKGGWGGAEQVERSPLLPTFPEEAAQDGDESCNTITITYQNNYI